MENLYELTADVHADRLPTQQFGVEFLDYLHGRLFGGVRDHAGRHRDDHWGAEYLSFGPNRSVPRWKVTTQLRTVFDAAAKRLTALMAEDGLGDDFELRALELAAWLHAEIVRIHPYEDGNGRTSRALMTFMLLRLGLPPVPVEACKEEYCEALNDYFRRRDPESVEPRREAIHVLVDLFLRIYSDDLSPRAG